MPLEKAETGSVLALALAPATSLEADTQQPAAEKRKRHRLGDGRECGHEAPVVAGSDRSSREEPCLQVSRRLTCERLTEVTQPSRDNGATVSGRPKDAEGDNASRGVGSYDKG